ncbi:MAG TPA: hypothetical protein PKD31_11010, partial [Blastocatellia bacterium]|nr:hypothetical protein [Blastocatellia bacterium]
SNVFPTGKGLFGFSTMAEAEAAMEEIARDYEGNRRAAREIAAEYFAAEKVTAEMLDRAGLPVASALSKTATNK